MRNVVIIYLLIINFGIFFNLGFTTCKAEQLLQVMDMELYEVKKRQSQKWRAYRKSLSIYLPNKKCYIGIIGMKSIKSATKVSSKD